VKTGSNILENLRHFGFDPLFAPVGVLLAEPAGFEPAGRPVEAHGEPELLPARHFPEDFFLEIIPVHTQDSQSTL